MNRLNTKWNRINIVINISLIMTYNQLIAGQLRKKISMDKLNTKTLLYYGLIRCKI